MKKSLTILGAGILLICYFTVVEAAVFTAIRDGNWSSASTWNGSGFPGEDDEAIINYNVTLDQTATVGTGTDTAITIRPFGTLTVAGDKSLTVKGDIDSLGIITMKAGSQLLMDTVDPSKIILRPGDFNAQGEHYPHLRINGTSSHPCVVRAIGNGHTKITDNDGSGGFVPTGGGRVEATFCDFSDLGGTPDYIGIGFQPLDPDTQNDAVTAPISFVDCTFTRCSRIRTTTPDTFPAKAQVEFNRCKWRESVVDPANSDPSEVWAILEARSHQGATFKILNCDFDSKVGLFNADDVQVENCVFRDGVHLNTLNQSKWRSFKNNFVRWPYHPTNFSILYGTSAEDNVFIVDHQANNNPHFVMLKGGSGPINITGNIFWYNQRPAGSEGDGVTVGAPSGGTRSQNTITIEKNIFLPNGNGPTGVDNISGTGFTLLEPSNIRQVIFNRNTLFVGSNAIGNAGGLVLGENHTSAAGDVASVRSNLFVGSRNNTNGSKIMNLGTEQDVFLAGNVDYNGSHYVSYGYAFNTGNGSGKGYDHFYFSGSDIIGAHDIDDEDPQFFDPYRTPATWTDSGTLEATMDWLSPGGGRTMQNLLSYIRKGFQPQNNKYAHAGDPAAGYPDIGAVDMGGSILLFLPPIIHAAKENR